MSGQSKGHQRQHRAHGPGHLKYRNEDRLVKNQARKMAGHLKRYPWDAAAFKQFQALPSFARTGLGVADKIAVSPASLRGKKGSGTTLTALRRAASVSSI